MSFFASGIGRVPNLLLSRSALSTLNRTNVDLFRTSGQLSTGLEIARPSDDAVRAAAIGEIDNSLERTAQRLRNLNFAESNLGVIDSALNDVADLAQEAQSLAIGQANIGPTADERASLATVVDSMLESLFRASNRENLSGYIFGGTRPGVAPVVEQNGSYRFSGEFGGLTPDLGRGINIPVTLGASNAIGAVSTRIEGHQQLDPALTMDTRVDDIRGAAGLGVSLGVIDVVVDGTDTTRIDLTGAATVRDISERITSALRDLETSAAKTILSPTPISVSGESIMIQPAAGVSIQFSDVVGGTSATDLGLDKSGSPFTPADMLSIDLQPTLTKRTPIASLQAITAPLGSVIVKNNSFETTIDLSGATTIGEIESAFETAGLGVRVELGSDGESLNIINEIAGSEAQALTITDAADGASTATRLGIRSFQRDTRVDDLNFGRGVRVIDTAPTAALGVDFQIAVGSTTVDIDLRNADLGTVGSVIDAINAQLAAAGVAPGTLQAQVVEGRNGITLVQNPASLDSVDVLQKNNSLAALDLGLLNGSYNATTRQYEGEDVGKVRVDNLFTHLIDLRDSLRADDVFGIQLASEKLAESADRLSDTRALVGGYARRVEDETRLEEDRSLLDETVRSNLRDADFAEAASRYSQLQTQLEAGLRTSAAISNLSLLDFIR
ncbi:MAG: flagellin [Planctomycetota bacterium]